MSDAGVSADAIAEMLAAEMTAAGRAADLGSGLHAVHRVVASVPTQVEAEDQRRLVVIANLARARASLDCAANYLAARSNDSSDPSRLQCNRLAITNESLEAFDDPAIDDKSKVIRRHDRVKNMTSAVWGDPLNVDSLANVAGQKIRIPARVDARGHDRFREDQLTDSTLLVVLV